MTANYKRYYSVLVLLLLGSSKLISQTVTNFFYTGSVQTFTVPACVGTITMDVRGAQGGTAAGGATGGPGGVAVGVMSVNAGDVLYIYVGGQNGYNGGGTITASGCSSA